MEILFLFCLLWLVIGEFGAGVRGAAVRGDDMMVIEKKTAPESVVAKTTTVAGDGSTGRMRWGGGKSGDGINAVTEVTGPTPSIYHTPPLNPAPELRVKARAYIQHPNALLIARATLSTITGSEDATPTPTETEVDTTITSLPQPAIHASEDPSFADQQKWHVETFWSCVTFDVMTHCGWHEPVLPGGDEVAGAGRVEVGLSWGDGRGVFAGRAGIGSLGVGVLGVAVVVAGLLI